MFKSSFLVSILLAAAAPACHHDHGVATPATTEPDPSGRTATAEPGNTSTQSNSYNSSATGPGATVPGNPALPEINDPDRTGSPNPSGSGAPNGTGTDTGTAKGVNGSPPDTTTPTMTKDSGSGSNTGTGSGSNRTRSGSSSRTTPSKPTSGSNGAGSADGSGSDVPPKE